MALPTFSEILFRNNNPGVINEATAEMPGGKTYSAFEAGHDKPFKDALNHMKKQGYSVNHDNHDKPLHSKADVTVHYSDDDPGPNADGASSFTIHRVKKGTTGGASNDPKLAKIVEPLYQQPEAKSGSRNMYGEELERVNEGLSPLGHVAMVHDDSGETVSHVPGVENTPAAVKKLRGQVLDAIAKKTGHSKNTVKKFQDQIDSEGQNHVWYSGPKKEVPLYHRQEFRDADHYIQHHSDIGADQLGKK